MDFESAMSNILDHVDAIENVTDSINYIREQMASRAADNDNQDWKTKYESLEKDYRERFFSNDMNTVRREDEAQARRTADEANEEIEKQEYTDIKLEDLLKD